jgi:formylglycine-generating enzyme required for sulfatase activity
MDNSVHTSLSPEEQERLTRLQVELEGRELTVLLGRLQQQYDLSVNQIAEAAGMDESALHKILKGENREFKAEHVDALLDELERLNKFANPCERAIWQRALRISAFMHFGLYKAVEPRLRNIPEPGKRLDALQTYLREQYPALAETYDNSGGTFPIFVPLIDIVARELNKRWGWIRIPPGYQLNRIEGNHYYLISTDFFPKKITDLGPELEIKDTGFGTYTIKRRAMQLHSIQPAPGQSTSSKPDFKRWGGVEFVRVPAGKFIMGSQYGNTLAWDDEKSQHTVDLPYDYWIGKYPVTNDQFSTFVKATGYRTSAEQANSEWTWLQPLGLNSTIWENGNHPVVQISWTDAMAYCKWLNTLAGAEEPSQRSEVAKGGGYTIFAEIVRAEQPSQELVRLPTEAEWEKAARGEYGNEWPWGNDFDQNKCNSREGGKGGTTPVGAYSPQGDSPYGVADMAGNVWEWCHSLLKPYPYSTTDGRENESSTECRVIRGGSFGYFGADVRTASRGGSFGFDALGGRTAYRGWDGPHYGYDSQGFRVVVAPRLA